MSDLPQQDVLIVDDEPVVRSVMAHVLTGAGYSVTSVENGRDALTAVGSNQFRAVVLDVHMPVMDGLRFFEVLETENAALAGRVLFVTAIADAPPGGRILRSEEVSCAGEALRAETIARRGLVSRWPTPGPRDARLTVAYPQGVL